MTVCGVEIAGSCSKDIASSGGRLTRMSNAIGLSNRRPRDAPTSSKNNNLQRNQLLILWYIVFFMINDKSIDKSHDYYT